MQLKSFSAHRGPALVQIWSYFLVAFERYSHPGQIWQARQITTTITTTIRIITTITTLNYTYLNFERYLHCQNSFFQPSLFSSFFPSFLLPSLSFFTHTNTYTMSSTTHKPPKPKSFSASSATGSSRSSSHLDAESQALKSKYSKQLETLRELFPDWKDEDLLPVLAETEGSLEEAIERISSGKHYLILPSFFFLITATISLWNFFFQVLC
jgi:hypothetical protein